MLKIYLGGIIIFLLKYQVSNSTILLWRFRKEEKKKKRKEKKLGAAARSTESALEVVITPNAALKKIPYIIFNL